MKKIRKIAAAFLAMAMAVCALGASTPSELYGEEAVSISYPTFFESLFSLIPKIVFTNFQ